MASIKRNHLNITITGHVQGVGFRFGARTMANSLGVKGFVKNLYTGQVYIEAEGSEVQLRHFLEWCHRGPSYSRITDVQTEDAEWIGFKYFDIKH